jgi:hypothetical protein
MITCNNKPTVFIVALMALLTAGPVLASTFTGTVDRLRFTPGATSARVSVLTAGPTDCPTSGGRDYAFEGADSGLGQLWTNALSQAFLQGRTVVIHGNGICDAFDIEGVLFIDVQ